METTHICHHYLTTPKFQVLNEMETLFLETQKILKSNGTLFVVMGIVCYALYSKLNSVEARYEEKMAKIMEQINDCNKQQVLILREQIEKNNRLLDLYETNRK